MNIYKANNKKSNGKVKSLYIDTSGISNGDVFKNYKELCYALGEIPASGTNSKNSHIRNMGLYFNFDVSGREYTILDIYDTPKEPSDNRSNGNSIYKIPLYETHPDVAMQWSTRNTYKEIPLHITKNTKELYWWDCKKCSKTIKQSPYSKLLNQIDSESFTCYYCTSSKHAKVVYDLLEYFNMDVKFEHSFSGLVGLGGIKLRFDFALMDQDEVVALVEYDGGFHDEDLNPCNDNYKLISEHDKRKNIYCMNNKIPLLRIHHSENDQIHIILHNFLVSLGLVKSQGNVEVISFLLEKIKYEETVLRKAEDRIAELKASVKELESL